MLIICSPTQCATAQTLPLRPLVSTPVSACQHTRVVHYFHLVFQRMRSAPIKCIHCDSTITLCIHWKMQKAWRMQRTSAPPGLMYKHGASGRRGSI
ncbi:hypothetical protein GDO78_018549 [Eleutherodactylus coqui]|uniref:Uncharacterized protein n=1 Tax=Eleutherodactylus coqui TaxID=57060 RepID=A0A8J6JY98_ELECQ|nr:hypothetical protein GDO78_018549 [Eleutherodactylus coqui]